MEKSFYHGKERILTEVRNFAATNAGTLRKRAGTKLLEHSDVEMFSWSSKKEIYIFFADEHYRVISAVDFTELKAKTAFPVGLTFQNIKDCIRIQTITNGILIPTNNYMYYSNSTYDFEIQQVLGSADFAVPDESMKFFIFLPGRSLVTYEDVLYFSTYGQPYVFDLLTDPAAENAVLEGYSLKFQDGIEGDIVDLIYFKDIVIIGTTEAIYAVHYTILNPFADSVAKISNNIRMERIQSIGISKPTLMDVGNYVVLANNRGIYAIQLTMISSGTVGSHASKIELLELTGSAEHIVSEDFQEILELSSYFRRENLFYALRNDGTLFKCVLPERITQDFQVFFTRIAAGERSFSNLDSASRTFVSQKGGTHYLEYNHEYPYLSDNRLVFSWADNYANLKPYAFLDCWIDASEKILTSAVLLTNTTLNTTANLNLGDSYYCEIGEEYTLIKIILKNGNVYTFQPTFNFSSPELAEGVTFVILGKQLTNEGFSSFDSLLSIAENQQVYLTYADVNVFPMRLKTVPYSKSTHFSSFFVLGGFGYEGVLTFLNVTDAETSVNPLRLNCFATELLEFKAFTSEGIARVDTYPQLRYSNFVKKVPFSSVEWKNYELMQIISPVGYSTVILNVQ